MNDFWLSYRLLSYIILYYLILSYIILYYIILYILTYVKLYYLILYYKILYNIILSYLILYYIFFYIILHYINVYYTILYYIILYCIISYYVYMEVSKNQGTPKSSSSHGSPRPDHSFLHYCPAAMARQLEICCSMVICYIANWKIHENTPIIDYLPIDNSDFPVRYVTNYQRVYR